ncbi:BZ3500_MvSof-1268-A1-R1_Chr2-2g04850 [Microbotryum saponariae]|uniref:BZ3500_MvSof-1268-A1-R1_Chr2-2g04850 protein n=1 Tax=Microbotryum saponariae TaxID=289078 RepID=A0A2X0L610_9BASI|nr:BZ3500_MvSof-1268-A1-R1_Chr2-2g04850 [Microbotryum saponariae]SDA00320.1 BZ3501_MvSof-1269-A2-R1_Chr2-2g04524 [Microbotryum saponariae]
MKEWPSTEACLTDDHVIHWCLAVSFRFSEIMTSAGTWGSLLTQVYTPQIQYSIEWVKEDKGSRSKFFIGLQNYLVKVGKRLGAKLDKEADFSIRSYLWAKYVEPTRRSAAASKFGTANSKDWKQPLARLQTTKKDAQSQMFLLVVKTDLDIHQVAKKLATKSSRSTAPTAGGRGNAHGSRSWSRGEPIFKLV